MLQWFIGTRIYNVFNFADASLLLFINFSIWFFVIGNSWYFGLSAILYDHLLFCLIDIRVSFDNLSSTSTNVRFNCTIITLYCIVKCTVVNCSSYTCYSLPVLVLIDIFKCKTRLSSSVSFSTWNHLTFAHRYVL